MKHMTRYFMFLLFLSVPSLLLADTLSLTTYYPAPFGAYSVLRLSPNSDASMGACDASKTGQLYLSSDSGDLKFCNGSSWGSTSPWALNAGSKYVYQNQSTTDTAYKIGIGIAAPTARLHVKGIDDATYGQMEIESSGSEAKLTLMNSSGASNTGKGSISMSNTANVEGMRFAINGVDNMFLDENGNIGMGVVLSPVSKLHIMNANTPDGQLSVDSSDSTESKITLRLAGVAKGHIAAKSGGDGLYLGGAPGVESMFISNTGKIAIGTPPNVAATESLHIRQDQNSPTIATVMNGTTTSGAKAQFNLQTGTANSYASLGLSENGMGASALDLITGDGVTNGMYFTSGATLTNIPIIFSQGATERMRIDSAGNVGIGVAAPVQKLDVAGGLHLSGPISGNLDSLHPASAGELQVDCQTTPGKCYAVYAP